MFWFAASAARIRKTSTEKRAFQPDIGVHSSCLFNALTRVTRLAGWDTRPSGGVISRWEAWAVALLHQGIG